MEAYIIGAVRTAVGRFNGSLTPMNAVELGTIVVKEIINRAKY